MSGGNESGGMWGECVGRIKKTDNSCGEAMAGRKGDSCG